MVFSIPFMTKGDVKYEGFLWKIRRNKKSSQWLNRDLFIRSEKMKKLTYQQ